jgi:hypothetical protein
MNTTITAVGMDKQFLKLRREDGSEQWLGLAAVDELRRALTVDEWNTLLGDAAVDVARPHPCAQPRGGQDGRPWGSSRVVAHAALAGAEPRRSEDRGERCGGGRAEGEAVMAALKLGSLNVLLTADTSPLLRGVQQAVKVTKKFADQVKQATGELGQMGVRMTAVFAGAIAVASKYDKAVSDQADRTKNLFAGVAVEVARTVLPALKRFNEIVAESLGWFQALDPAVKASVSHWAVLSVEVLAVAAAVSKLAGMVSGVAGLVGAFLPLAATLLPVVVALGAIWVASAVLRDALGKDFSQIVDWVEALWHDFVEFARPAFKWVADAAGRLVGVFGTVLKTIHHAIVEVFKKMVDGIAWLFEKLGHPIDGLREFLTDFANWSDDLVSNNGLAQMFDDAVEKSKVLSKTLKGDVRTWTAWTQSMLPDFSKGKAPKLPDDPNKYAFSEAPKVDHSKTFTDLVFDNESEVMRAVRSVQEGFEKIRKDGEKTARDIGRAFEKSFRGLERGGGLNMARAFNGRDFRGEIGSLQKQIGETAGDQSLTADERSLKMEGLKAAVERISTEAGDVADAFGNVIGGVLNKMGKMGQLVNTVMSASAGGPWAMLIAAVGELVMGSKQAASLINMLNDGFDMISNLIGEFIQPLLAFSGAGNLVLKEFVNFLTPIIKSLGESIQNFTPMLMAVGQSVKVMGFVLAPLIAAIEGINHLVSGALGFVLHLFYDAMRGFSHGILWLINEFGQAWNTIVTALGRANLAINLDGVAEAMSELRNATWDNVMAQADAASAGAQAAAAISAVAESMTNVPAGFKIAAARYNAMDAVGVASLPADPTARYHDAAGRYHDASPGLPSDYASGGGNTYITVNVAGSVTAAKDLEDELAEIRREQRARKKGGRGLDF